MNSVRVQMNTNLIKSQFPNGSTSMTSPQQSATPSITNSPDSVDTQHNVSNPLSEYEVLQRELEHMHLEESTKRNIIVDKLYETIESIQPLLCAKITGMIIHKQSTNKLLALLTKSHRKILENKIREAIKILSNTQSGGLYGPLYHDLTQMRDSNERASYLRLRLYPYVADYVKQENLANIITEMLLHCNVSEIMVLLNEHETLIRRINEAVKTYLEWNADFLNKIKTFQ